MRLIKDTILLHDEGNAEMESDERPLYHLQDGATPVQELAYALATAMAIVRHGEEIGRGAGSADGRRSRPHLVFFVNAGMRFITEMCKMRAFVEMWDEMAAQRYGIDDPKQRLLWRAGRWAHRAAAGTSSASSSKCWR